MLASIHVASYIESQLGEMSQSKLHNLLFYCQAWHLVYMKEKLFQDDLIATESGFVCKELLNNVVDSREKKLSFIKSVENDCSMESINLLNLVLSHYGLQSDNWLSSCIKRELPWKNANRQKESVVSCLELMDYYSMFVSK